MIELLNRGPKLVNYLGHGSVNTWRGGLLTSEDARELNNSQSLSVFVMMTCLNGYFDDPVTDSLAESLLMAERGGAVAVWASSGLTYPQHQSWVNQEVYRLLFAASVGRTKPMTIGEAAMRAKSSVTDSDVRRTWILLGDPTLEIK